MSAFNSIMDKARAAASAATKKTGTAVELSRMKLQTMQFRSQIQSTYERIGILIYEQEKSGTDNTELTAVCIREIDDLLKKLNDVNASISAIKDGVKCPNCGKANPVDTLYCKKCGVSLKKRNDA